MNIRDNTVTDYNPDFTLASEMLRAKQNYERAYGKEFVDEIDWSLPPQLVASSILFAQVYRLDQTIRRQEQAIKQLQSEVVQLREELEKNK